MAAASALTSALPLLALLEEPDVDIRGEALRLLDGSVETLWPELAPALVGLEALAEDASFADHGLAASVASKVYHHMGEPADALRLALAAGFAFDAGASDSYTRSVVATCVDAYCAHQRAAAAAAAAAAARAQMEDEDISAFSADAASSSSSSSCKPAASSDENAAAVAMGGDARVAAIVDRVLQQCISAGAHADALGLALEAHRLDVVRQALLSAPAPAPLMRRLYELASTTIALKAYREEVLRTLVDLYMTPPSDANTDVASGAGASSSSVTSDVPAMAQCLYLLGDAERVAQTLGSLVSSAEARDHLLAYQVAFDLAENQHLPFAAKVTALLPQYTTSTSTSTSTSSSSTTDSELAARVQRLSGILDGSTPASLHVSFLNTRNKTDLAVLDRFKAKAEPRNATVHGALVQCHAFMQAGTTNDAFLRNNMEWMRQATAWNRFSATAALGVLHRGQTQAAQAILASYLPPADRAAAPAEPTASSFQEGGALYAMGLVSAGQSQAQVPYLRRALAAAGANEVLLHGACLGLGLAAVASHDEAIAGELMGVAQQHAAVPGEAAGYALGLVLLGSGHAALIQEMLALARESPHEKTIRGLAVGLALTSLGREEAADGLADALLADRDPILRYGGCWTLAMAHAATGAGSALRRLLRAAVSDASDDVRRAAVTCIGFVLANDPAQVPALVSLLAESYNPHVRYGACMAVGVACAGRAADIPAAWSLLQPLLADKVDYVRQAAFTAAGMLLQLATDAPATKGKIAAFRAAVASAILRRGDTPAKVGVHYGAGLADAGGRNSVIAMQSPAGHKRPIAVAGMALFCQFWHWYPLASMLSLALTPAALIGVDASMRVPDAWKVVSAAPVSHFAYPAAAEAKKTAEAKAKVVNVLSVGKKAGGAGAGAAGGKLEPGKLTRVSSLLSRAQSAVVDTPSTTTTGTTTAMTDSPTATTSTTTTADELKEDDPEAAAKAAAAAKKAEDARLLAEKRENERAVILSNPLRVTIAQRAKLVHAPLQRFTPVVPRVTGIVVLEDSEPDAPVSEAAHGKAVTAVAPGIDADEPPVPAPFKLNL